ncbi:hypothetical protein ACQKWADRAFT_281579 [Trichoderma austrokoningii]
MSPKKASNHSIFLLFTLFSCSTQPARKKKTSGLAGHEEEKEARPKKIGTTGKRVRCWAFSGSPAPTSLPNVVVESRAEVVVVPNRSPEEAV